MKKLMVTVLVACSLNYASADDSIPAKLPLCSACHGPAGISPNPQWPNIAGQHAPYLLKQLQEFKQAKNRNIPIMSAITASLSEVELEELALYYTQQPPASGSTPKRYLKRGEQLYRGGDFNKHITACIACHGPQGQGNAQAGFPALSGQHAPYTIQQLHAFKSQQRTNDINAIMRTISARMDAEDMTAVAYYIQGLH